MEEKRSFKEDRIRNITSLYYSKPEVQKAIFEFSKSREICPRYFEGFGKRPDTLEYPGDVFEIVKKGATSFHCSEELWKNPMEIKTGMNENQLNEIRDGWDFILDIDSKYIDYSKIMVELIAQLLQFHGVKNFGIKFSGSKGFHMIVPWKSFPKEINGLRTSDMFPEYPRIMTKYITSKIKNKLIKKISELSQPNKYIKDFQASQEVMPDLILVSPRHLFRTPYSLHEKTALASIVLNNDEIENFELKDADPMKIKIRDFMPQAEEDEAKELLMQSLDWDKEHNPEQEEKKEFNFKPINISNVSEKNFPPSILKILEGISDGRKRALFILINFLRSVNLERDVLEKKIDEWNEKNKPPLKKGYVQTQIVWAYRNKTVPPPNFDKDYYKGIGIIPTEEELRYKNPINYVVKKNFNLKPKKKMTKKYNNF